jgi:hypothetical protein
MAEGWWAAGNVPTAEDRLVRALLLGYTVLTELAPGEVLVTCYVTLSISPALIHLMLVCSSKSLQCGVLLRGAYCYLL